MRQHNTLIAGQTSSQIERLLPLGRLLAGEEAGALHVAGLVRVRAERSLSTGTLRARELRQRLEPVAREAGADFEVAVTHDLWHELSALARATPDALTLLDWRTAIQGAPGHMPGNVAVFRGRMPRPLNRILLPIRGGPNAELALRLALTLAEARGAEITIMHMVPGARQGDTGYQSFLRHLRSLPAVTRWVNVQSRDVAVAIRSESVRHQMLIMGAVAYPDPSILSPIATQLAAAIPIPLLVVKSGRVVPQWTTKVPPLDYTISVVVDKWFAENSYSAAEFADLKRLLALKEKQGLTISIGLPTLNEEQTVGQIIETIRCTLMKDVPLVDELAVIDSISTDRTVEIAESLGVPVHRHPDLLPEHGTRRGKGEALWKSLTVLKGDLIAWVDTDIENFHPRFVYGVIGPLLRNPRLMYTKGFYHRPLKSGDRIIEGGGGRVTELVARPLLNLFFPELSGFVQPLSGEYAGRRQALMQIPFFSGYGVETGMLIDMLLKFGLGAIGQVDLEERIHHSQSLEALSRMSFAILQVVMQRVGDLHQLALMETMNQSLKQILYGDEQLALEVQDIRDLERPPMATVLNPEHKTAVPG